MNRFIFIISITMLLLTSCAVGQKKLSIVVTAQFETDAGYELALKESKAELEKNNYQTTISYDEKGDELPNNDKIIVGNFESEEEIGGSSIDNEAYKISKIKGITPNVLKIQKGECMVFSSWPKSLSLSKAFGILIWKWLLIFP